MQNNDLGRLNGEEKSTSFDGRSRSSTKSTPENRATTSDRRSSDFRPGINCEAENTEEKQSLDAFFFTHLQSSLCCFLAIVTLY